VSGPTYFGLAPLEQFPEEVEAHLAWARRTGSLWLEALAIQALGTYHAARGDRDKGKELIARGMSIISDLGMRLFAAGLAANWIWLVTDDPVAVEAQIRKSYNTLAEAGDKSVGSTVAVSLAEALYRQGRYGEAEGMLAASEVDSASEDVFTYAYGLAMRAKLLARSGRIEEAETTARKAVELARATEYVDLRGDSLLALGEVLHLAGRLDEAAEAMQEALHLWEAKGNVVFASRTSALLSELQTSLTSP
jgi:tetratricopeptide (TPR) repeat protein